jgi:hypothetical protein
MLEVTIHSDPFNGRMLPIKAHVERLDDGHCVIWKDLNQIRVLRAAYGVCALELERYQRAAIRAYERETAGKALTAALGGKLQSLLDAARAESP